MHSHPCRELWRLLRPTTAVPAGVQVHDSDSAAHAANSKHAEHSGTGADGGEAASGEQAAALAEHKGAAPAGAAASKGAQLRKKAMDTLEGSASKLEGYGPDLVADQLTHALQVRFGPLIKSLAGAAPGPWIACILDFG